LIGISLRKRAEVPARSGQPADHDYGDLVSDGVLIGAPMLPQEAQFRTVGLYHFDGKGNITGLEHTVVNGMVDPDFAEGFPYGVRNIFLKAGAIATPGERGALSR
jgi:hypothetical protein